jgi:hypothetical protein
VYLARLVGIQKLGFLFAVFFWFHRDVVNQRLHLLWHRQAASMGNGSVDARPRQRMVVVNNHCRNSDEVSKIYKEGGSGHHKSMSFLLSCLHSWMISSSSRSCWSVKSSVSNSCSTGEVWAKPSRQNMMHRQREGSCTTTHRPRLHRESAHGLSLPLVKLQQRDATTAAVSNPATLRNFHTNGYYRD